MVDQLIVALQGVSLLGNVQAAEQHLAASVVVTRGEKQIRLHPARTVGG